MAEPATNHAERRLSMIPFAVQGSGPVRPVLPERSHLLIERFRLREMSGVLLDAVQRHGAMLACRQQARLAVIRGISQTPLRYHVVGETFPDVGEHLALMHVRGSELVAEHDETIRFDGCVRLHPVLHGLEAVVDLAPRPLATGEAGRIGGDDGFPLREHPENELVEPLPDGRPSGTAVLPAKYGMMWNGIEPEVLPEQLQERLELTEGGIEQLAHKEGDQQIAFLDRWSSAALAPLPERE